MSSGSETRTYTGVWTNWSHGAILGATLTLSQRDGSFLAAFLALYVSFAGTMFWRFLKFILHQLNATEPGAKRDALHHQRQAILRNSSGAAEAFLEFVAMPWNWRSRAQRPFLRISAYALLTALNVAVFGVASIFTSAVTRAPGSAVIVLGPHCGGHKLAPNTTVQSEALSYKILADTNEAATYVRQCYRGNGTSRACGVYYRPRLNFTTTPNVSCPFASGVCLPNKKSAFSMDTGLMDSHLDLGSNSRPEHRIKFRRVTTCSPLTDTPWSRIENGTDRNQIIYIDAGPVYGGLHNYTFTYNTRSAGNGFGYTLSAVYALAGANANGVWIPDKLLNRTDADVVLMMLNQNDIAYEAPSDDPWMPAHTPVNDTPDNDIWEGDYSLNLMGCTEQYQICNPNKAESPSACTKLLGQTQVIRELASPENAIGFDEHQIWTAGRILAYSIEMGIFQSVQDRGASALNANEYTIRTVQPPIPPTQWQTEVSIWFSVCLAKLQSYMVEWATAPNNLAVGPGNIFVVNEPTDAIGAAMCRNQMVNRTGGQQSFSVLGIALIFALGGVLIVLGMAVDTLYGWLRRKSDYRRLQWILDDKLQLQRAAYEGSGVSGIWEGRLEAVPTTAGDSVLIPPSSDVFLDYRGTPEGRPLSQHLKY